MLVEILAIEIADTACVILTAVGASAFFVKRVYAVFCILRLALSTEITLGIVQRCAALLALFSRGLATHFLVLQFKFFVDRVVSVGVRNGLLVILLRPHWLFHPPSCAVPRFILLPVVCYEISFLLLLAPDFPILVWNF